MAQLGPIDLVGDGEYSFTLVNVFGGNGRITTVGPYTTVYGTGGVRRLLRAGWFAFGYHYADPDSVTGTHLFQPQWIDFDYFQFTPFLYGIQGYAERFVWSMSPGTEGRLWIDTA
jgi:hypothetical protein